MRFIFNYVIPYIIGAILLLVVNGYEHTVNELTYYLLTTTIAVITIATLALFMEDHTNFVYVAGALVLVWISSILIVYNMNNLLKIEWLANNIFILEVLAFPVKISDFIMVTLFLSVYQVIKWELVRNKYLNYKRE